MNKAKIERMAREARVKTAQTGAKSAEAGAKSGTATPKSGTATPKSGTAQPKSGTAQPKSGTAQPKSGTATPKSGTAQPKSATASAIASDAREAAQERETRGAVNLTPETIDAIVGGFSRELRRALLELGPILARLAAVDTIHSVERVATVLGRAVVEGRTAADVVKDLGVEG